MHTGSSWIRRSSELTRKSSVTLASVICYLQSTQIKCISLGEHLLLSSIDFMFQADNREISLACKEHMPYPRFTKLIISHFISKEKTISMRNKINLHTVRDDTLLDIKDSKAYKTNLDFATRKATPKKARKFKKVASPSRKLSPVLEEEPVVKPKRAKRHAKKSTTMPTSSVVIRDTPSEFMPKKKTSAKVDRGKGMYLLSNVALLEAAQLKKTLKKRKMETHKLYESGSGDEVGSLPKVPDEQEDKTTGDSGDDDVTKDDDNDDVKSDADGDKEASDSEKIDSDKDGNPNLNQNDDEEEYKEEYHEEEGKGDVKMKDAGRDDSTQQTTYEQVKDDEHVILTIFHDTQKTEIPLQSSSVLSNFANQFLNLDNVLPTDNEVISMMNVKVRHKETTFNLLKGTYKCRVELEYHFEECYKAVTDRLDWTNPEGHEYPFDLNKPLPLIEDQGRQVVPAKYFINNDLEYLKGGSSSRKYMTSTTKTKAAKYDTIESIKDMFYGYARNKQSKHDMFSTKRIIAVTHVKDMKWEGDFPRLNLCDIEDLLLPLVQKKLSNLERDVIYDLNVALRMFTRCFVIFKRVEVLQLGVESYQKKLNITKPETFRSDITNMTPYTAYNNPQGIIYLDKLKRNRLMRSDELYKFYDGTLTSVRRVLHDIASNLRRDYLPKRR
ncbi:hypothetical protein Tco_0216827 [Tanacetum coccineum]